MAYVQNNIRFRSVSSMALRGFYNSKSFILNELIDERKQFSQVAREVMLLFFNSYSDWVTKVESLLLNRLYVDESDVYIIFQRFGEVVESNKHIFTIHNDVFLPHFMQVWGRAHRHIPKTFKRKCKQVVGMSQLEAYPLIIDALVNALQSTWYELYEIDCLLGSNMVTRRVTTNASNPDNLLTYIDEDTLDYFKQTGTFVLQERLNYYLDHVVKSDLVVPIVVKNYTEEEIALTNGVVVGDQPLARLLTDMQENPRIKIIEIV